MREKQLDGDFERYYITAFFMHDSYIVNNTESKRNKDTNTKTAETLKRSGMKSIIGQVSETVRNLVALALESSRGRAQSQNLRYSGRSYPSHEALETYASDDDFQGSTHFYRDA